MHGNYSQRRTNAGALCHGGVNLAWSIRDLEPRCPGTVKHRMRRSRLQSNQLSGLQVEKSSTVGNGFWDWHQPHHPARENAVNAAPQDEWKLMSVLAHEVRGPLAALVMSSERLAEDVETQSPDELRQMATRIHRRAIWLQGLFENLLTAASLERDALEVHPARIELTDIVRDVHLLLGPLLTQRGLRLRVRTSGPRFEVWADAQRITQVLVNLLLNAVKYSGTGTAIDILLSARPGYVRLAVSDRGPGVAPSHAELLFHPFFRAPQTTAGSEGLGLGLAIVRGIIEAHGGRVGVVNRRGDGARFWCDLPMAEPSNTYQLRQLHPDDPKEKKEATTQ